MINYGDDATVYLQRAIYLMVMLIEIDDVDDDNINSISGRVILLLSMIEKKRSS